MSEELVGVCVETTYARNPAGYGLVGVGGVPCLHHRYIYATSNKIPLSAIDGKVVRHRCDNPACINIDHLVLGTQKDNVADMVKRGRHVGFTSESKANAKLTEDQVREIKRRGREEIRKLAHEFGVSNSAIERILNGRSWSNVK